MTYIHINAVLVIVEGVDTGIGQVVACACRYADCGVCRAGVRVCERCGTVFEGSHSCSVSDTPSYGGCRTESYGYGSDYVCTDAPALSPRLGPGKRRL